MVMGSYRQLYELLSPGIQALGSELLTLEMSGSGDRLVLRLFIDKSPAVTLDDCEEVSRYVSGVLAVEDPIPGSYTLEVSSPGADRPLVTMEHFARFVGRDVQVRLFQPKEGRRNFRGALLAAENGEIRMQLDGQTLVLDLAAIQKANLVPRYD